MLGFVTRLWFESFDFVCGFSEFCICSSLSLNSLIFSYRNALFEF